MPDLDCSAQSALRITRVASLQEPALAILEEYYRAVDVVKRDGPEAMRALLAQPDAAMWVAHRGKEIVGCVVLRPLPSIARAGECKRLYVQPAARGCGIADRLMDALEEFAGTRSLDWVYLDSHDGLKSAIALYERRGYQHCQRYNDNPQATVFLRKQISAEQAKQRADNASRPAKANPLSATGIVGC